MAAASAHEEEDGWDDWSDDGEELQGGERRSTAVAAASSPSPVPVAVDEARVAHYEGQIKAYILDVADPAILESIDAQLRGQEFSALAEYYLANEKLARYTAEHEIARMAYRVLNAGTLVAEEGDVDGAKRAFAVRPSAMVWRFANQSLWAEMLGALQLKFFRPDLDVAVVSRHSRFTVDLSEETLQAASTFHVLLAAGNDHTVASIGGGGIDAGDGVLEVATLEGKVDLNIPEQRLEQSVKLTGLKPVFDDAIRRVAHELAEREAHMSAHTHHKGGGGGSTQSLREQVLLATGGLRAVGRGATGLLAGVSMLGQGLRGLALEEAAALEDSKEVGVEDEEKGAVETRTRPAVRREGGGVRRFVGARRPLDNHRQREGEGAGMGAAALLNGASERLWGFLEGQYDGDMHPSTGTAQQAQQQEQQVLPPHPLPPPPSQLLTGLITGVGGFLASGIERAASAAMAGEEEDEGDLPLGKVLRRKAAREARATAMGQGKEGEDGTVRLYRREG